MIPKKFRIHVVLIVACALMFIVPYLSGKPDAEKEERATAVASEFLALMDADQYAQAWQTMAKLTQEKVGQREWVDNWTKARGFSGALKGRIKESSSYSLSSPGAPDGEYILLTFDSSYERVEKAIELITVMLEDGHWKVAAYIANSDK